MGGKHPILDGSDGRTHGGVAKCAHIFTSHGLNPVDPGTTEREITGSTYAIHDMNAIWPIYNCGSAGSGTILAVKMRRRKLCH